MKKLLVLAAFLVAATGLQQSSAQGSGGQKMGLQEAIKYGIEHRATVQNARIDTEIAKAKVGEIRAIGLPQINGAVDAARGQQPFFLPGAFIPDGPADELIGLQSPLSYSGSAGLTFSQLLFDGSYLIGLKASRTYTELSRKQLHQTEIEVADAVTRAYYTVLVTDSRMALVDQNISRLDTVLRQTRAMFNEGFAESIDADRIEVSLNNLKAEREKIIRLQQLSYQLLKYQMGMPQTEQLSLTGNLRDIEIDARQSATNTDYSKRIEYSILETQKELSTLDLKNNRAGYYPKLFLSGRYGAMTQTTAFADLTKDISNRYFQYHNIGVSLQMPIFDGLQRNYLVQQAKLNLKKVDNGFNELKQAIDLQNQQAATNVQNSLEQLEISKRNMTLAREVARVTGIKFREGVGSNIEVVTAETALKEAETNYFNALYDLVISQVDLQKAQGTLY